MSEDSIRVEPSDGHGASLRLSGRVERQRLALGTKSEHMGMVLLTPAGGRHVLRLRGGNPFKDPVLEALEGQYVTLRGQLRENFFLVDNPPEVAD